MSLLSGIFFYLSFKMQQRATPYYEQLPGDTCHTKVVRKNCSLQPATGSRMKL